MCASTWKPRPTEGYVEDGPNPSTRRVRERSRPPGRAILPSAPYRRSVVRWPRSRHPLGLPERIPTPRTTQRGTRSDLDAPGVVRLETSSAARPHLSLRRFRSRPHLATSQHPTAERALHFRCVGGHSCRNSRSGGSSADTMTGGSRFMFQSALHRPGRGTKSDGRVGPARSVSVIQCESRTITTARSSGLLGQATGHEASASAPNWTPLRAISPTAGPRSRDDRMVTCEELHPTRVAMLLPLCSSLPSAGS